MLRVRYRMRHRNLSAAEGPGSGPQGRINKMRKLVTALVRHERIEGHWFYLDEARGYTELLIQQAQKHGDQHAATMEMCDFWLLEKDLIHKLFKVLVPRYNHHPVSFTKLNTLPTVYPGGGPSQGLLELKGNPWPPVVPKERDLKGSLVNVLLDEVRKEYRQKKYALIAKAETGVSATDPARISGSIMPSKEEAVGVMAASTAASNVMTAKTHPTDVTGWSDVKSGIVAKDAEHREVTDFQDSESSVAEVTEKVSDLSVDSKQSKNSKDSEGTPV